MAIKLSKMSVVNSLKIVNNLNISMNIVNEFKWLIDAYVLDFYAEEHWNRLRPSWKSMLENIEPEILMDLFKQKPETVSDQIVWPLSLLCLRAVLYDLTISRDSQKFDKKYKSQLEPLCYTHPKLKNLFRKRVKTKKQHEIERMSVLCKSTASDCNVKYIIDCGAGLGHLSRVLGFGYGLNVCCLEQQKQLTDQAKIIDEHLEGTAKKFLELDEIKKMRAPVHLNVTLTNSTDINSLLEVENYLGSTNLVTSSISGVSHNESLSFKHVISEKICECFRIPIEERQTFTFGIVGLHPCGDLAAILLNIFLNCHQAKFLNIVGCCYMKMTNSSFPLSSLLENRSHLSYEGKEIACHAQETYVRRLAEKCYDHLKVHSYRAAIEKIICKHWPCLKHAGLKSIKHTDELSFWDYCTRSTSHLNIEIPVSDIFSAEVENDLKCWKKVVIFYTLRLLLAPLVESVILSDRMLCVLEKGHSVKLEAIFDPLISPRNHVMTAIKNK